MKIALIGINSKYIHKNLAIYALYSYVRDLELDIDLLEFSINESLDKIFYKINRGKYDVICFTTYVWNKEIVLKLSENLKTINNNLKIVLGGPEISEAYLVYSFIDHLIIGEGEISFRKLLESKFELPKLLRNIDEYIDLNKQTFVYEGLLDQLENKIIYYEGSRGCPFRCTYCLSGTDNTLRLKSAEKILEEIESLVKNGVKQVKFIDRTFNADVTWAKSIVEGLFKLSDFNCNFHFEISLDKMNDILLNLLQDSPDKLFQLEIGIQTTNQDTLRAIKRTNDFVKIKERIEFLLSRGNLHLHTDLIAGLPYEDLDSFKKSFNEIYELKAQMLQVGFLKVIPNTVMYKDANIYGIEYRNYPPYEILRNNWLSSDDLLEIKYVEEAIDSFYNKKYFRQTFIYLIEITDNHFNMFRSMGKVLFNLENILSLNDKYEFLYKFIISYYPKVNNNTIFALLQLDWCLTNNNKRLPYFLRFEKSMDDFITLPIDVTFSGHDISLITQKSTKYKLNYNNKWSIFEYPEIEKIQ